MRRHSVLGSLVGVSLVLVTLASCVDAPSAPEGQAANGDAFILAPVFALVGPDGSVVSGPQASALGDAFDQVDRFRMVVTRIPSGQVALDTIISVTPGQSEYDLSVDVTVNGASEQFSVTLTALKGDVELFTADPITVTATPAAAGAGTPPPTPTNVTLRYSGPGSTATSITLTPAQAVLAPGGTVQLAAQVLDQAGQPISGVPLAWVASAPAVATVGATGLATGAGDGKAQITVATPTGLQAQAWIYVISGELAYVEGGDLKVRAPAGGTATVRATGGASTPAWTADGGKLYYSAGGQVRLAGGGALAGGAWPAPSPDGTKLVVDGVTFFNDDGSNPTTGPSGSTPLWLDGETLLVAGGSLQQVRADGSGRSTVVDGDATMPALSGSGALAYVFSGDLRVQGREAALLTGAGGRPTWSADGAWLVVRTGSGLAVVPSDGSGPPIALPGLGDASDPAFRPSGGMPTPPTPTVTTFDPAAPRPGEIVTLVGSGFDWIIPANTRVFWPVAGGSVEGTVQKVTATEIHVLMPASVVAGQVRVTTRAGTGLLAFTPSTATLDVSAQTSWGAPVAGMAVVVKNTAGTVLGQGTTNAEGTAIITGIEPGSVTVQISAPTGYVLDGDAVRTLTLASGPSSLALVATPQVKSVKLTPEKPALGILDEVGITVQPLDINGVPIPEVASISWASASSRLEVWEGGLSTTIVGRQPSVTAGDAAFTVSLDGQPFGFTATVTSSITGTVTQDAPPSGAPEAASFIIDAPAASAAVTEPAPNITVNVLRGEETIGTATTSASGSYTIGGLYAGTYDVAAIAKGDYSSVPATQTITLDAARPTGKADFHMSLGVTDSLDAAVAEDTIEALGAMTTVTFQAFDADDVPLGARPATFASTDPAVLTVDGAGKVTAIDNGSAWVRVTVDGVNDSVLVTVDQKAVSLQLFQDVGEPAPDSGRVLVQEEFQILYEAKDARGNLIPPSHRKPTYAPNTGKVEIDADGYAIASAWDVGRSVIVASMDAGADTVIVWVLGVRAGDLNVNYDLATMADSLYGQIRGTLWIDASGLTDVDALSPLMEVWGDVNIRDNASLTDLLGLANIEYIGGTVRIKRNAVLVTPTGLPAAAIEHIGGSLKIWDNPLITNASVFGNLERVNGDIDIQGNAALTDVSGLSSLSIAGGLSLVSNQVLSVTAGFPALEWLGWGGLYVDEGATALRLPKLKGIEGELTVGGVSSPLNPIESLDFPSLQCVEYLVWIYENEDLTQARFPALTNVGGCDTPFDYEAAASPAPVAGAWGSAPPTRLAARLRPDPEDGGPRSLEARRARLHAKLLSARETMSQERVRADAERTAAAALQRAAGAPRVAGVREVAGRTPPRARPARQAEPMRAYEWGGGFLVEDNPQLTVLDLSALTGIDGELSFGANALGTFTIPLLETIGEALNIRYSDLVSLSLPALNTVGDDIWIESNDYFERLLAPTLESVGDNFYVYYNQALGDFVLESLRHVGYNLDFYSNTWDGVLELPVLEDVYSDIYIYANTGLTRVEIATESLLTVGYYFQVDRNDGLQTIDVPGAHYLYYLDINYNPDLLSVDMATETTLEVDSDFRISSNDLLQTIDMPGLASAYYLDIYSNPALMTVDLATATDLTVDWTVYVSYNAVPHAWSLNIPGLVHAGGSLQINNNDGLKSVTVATSGPATILGQVDVLTNNQLESFNAPSLAQVGTHYMFNVNPALTSASLGSLTTIGGLLHVEQTGLANLGGFASLTSALAGLNVFNNASLTDVTGLNGIGSATGTDPVITGTLNIQNNPSLCQADAEALHTFLEAKYGGTAAGAVAILNNKACGV